MDNLKERGDQMLGRRIAALRRQTGLSQAGLAQRLGISASAMGMYEQGRREPSVETLVSMAREFGVSTDFLLTGKLRSTEEDETMIKMLLDRPVTKQEMAVLLAELLMKM